MRQIMFRVWTGKEYRFPPPLNEWDFEDCELFSGYGNKAESIESDTGYLDANGLPTFENDIIDLGRGSTGIIYWSDSPGGGWVYECEHAMALPMGDGYKIIGNVHENPELVG
jgi:hypothetical protein